MLYITIILSTYKYYIIYYITKIKIKYLRKIRSFYFKLQLLITEQIFMAAFISSNIYSQLIYLIKP